MNTKRLLKRAVKEIHNGQIINLGIGLPTQIIDYLPDDADVLLHSENGILGSWKTATREDASPFLIDAGGKYVGTRAGTSFFDSATSFAMIRRGKIDLAILGAFEVDQEGSLANWKIPGKYSPGIGGAMELAQKTPKLVVLCAHKDKQGQSKILKKCQLPVTARHCISRVITDLAVMDVTPEGLLLKEISEDISLGDLLAVTEAELLIPDTIGRF